MRRCICMDNPQSGIIAELPEKFALYVGKANTLPFENTRIFLNKGEILEVDYYVYDNGRATSLIWINGEMERPLEIDVLENKTIQLVSPRDQEVVISLEFLNPLTQPIAPWIEPYQPGENAAVLAQIKVIKNVKGPR